MAKPQKKTRKKKNKGGRPTKYTQERLRQVQILAEKGFTDKEIAKVFGVTKQTVCNWKKKYPRFFDSLKEGKKIADERVVKSLYERACGYSHPDTYINNYKGKITKTNLTKHYPPDTTACVFWLKNRDPENWKDKQEHDVSNDYHYVIELVDGKTGKKTVESSETKSSGQELPLPEDQQETE